MDETATKTLKNLINNFYIKNYNYLYLNYMLNKAKSFKSKNSTLITGSSYALSGIKEDAWNNAVSCSCSSQDLYYDFRCAHDVISIVPHKTFSKCFIVKGYYAACHDLSRSKQERERIITDVYYPILHDAHNWEAPYATDLFAGIFLEGSQNVDPKLKTFIEQCATDILQKYGTYYNPTRARGGTVFNLNGREWHELAEDEKENLGKYRADCHNKLFSHKASIEENKEIFKDYIHYLHLNDILPIFVLAPFTPCYSKYILPEMKESIIDLLNTTNEEVHFVDFNQCSYFDEFDFCDTDHLSEIGAQKMSWILAEMFGK